MSTISLRSKRNLSEKIENNGLQVKKRKHITVQSENSENNSTDWKPPNWERTIDNIRRMRQDNTAPVDKMGCDKTADLNEPPEVNIFM